MSRRVVVDAHEIEGRRDGRQVAVQHLVRAPIPRLARPLPGSRARRSGSRNHRLNWSSATRAASRSRGCGRGRVLRLEVQHQPGGGLGRVRPNGLRRRARGPPADGGPRRAPPRVRCGRARATHAIAVVRDDVGLVQRGEVANAVAEPGGDHGRVTRRTPERSNESGQPPASSRACGRSQWYSVTSGCDVVRRGARRRAGRRSRGPLRSAGHARRASRAARLTENRYAVEPEVGHQLDVLAVAVVVVARDVAGVVVARTCPACGRSGPRCSRRARRPGRRPRSGRPRSRRPRRTRAGTVVRHPECHFSPRCHDPADGLDGSAPLTPSRERSQRVNLHARDAGQRP